MSQTKDWIYVENSSDIFRKTEFYELKWNIDNTLVKAANFSGPVAITRDINKTDVRPFISIYSQSGYSIKTFQLEDKSQIVGIGWTSMEDLIVILENGEIQIRSMFGQLKNLFNVIKDSRAIDYRIFNTINTYSGTFTTGCVILTAKNKFILVKDVYDPKLQQFPDIPGQSELDSWCVVSTDKKCFILASRGTDIYQIAYGGTPQSLVLK